eukprot:SAG31_NODE_4360_length_3312_cov_2.190787_3_plen_74_part_00
MDVRLASLVFWQWIFAFVHSSTIASTNAGELDEGKLEYTWGKFMPGCLMMGAAAFKDLELAELCNELIDSSSV